MKKTVIDLLKDANPFKTHKATKVQIDDHLTRNNLDTIIEINPQSDIPVKKLTKIMIMIEKTRDQLPLGHVYDYEGYIKRHRLEDHVKVYYTSTSTQDVDVEEKE